MKLLEKLKREILKASKNKHLCDEGAIAFIEKDEKVEVVNVDDLLDEVKILWICEDPKYDLYFAEITEQDVEEIINTLNITKVTKVIEEFDGNVFIAFSNGETAELFSMGVKVHKELSKEAKKALKDWAKQENFSYIEEYFYEKEGGKLDKIV